MYHGASYTLGKEILIWKYAMILLRVTIGRWGIIGANSTVTKSIPSRTITFNNPTRVHKIWKEKSRRWGLVDEA